MSLSFGNTATTPSSVSALQNLEKIEALAVVFLSTPASTQILPGDTIVWNSAGNSGAGCIQPVSTVAWDTNLQTTQTDALTVFVGFAMGQKDSIDASTASIPVAIRGFARFPCTALGSASTLGAGVAPAGQGTHNLSDFNMAIATSQASTFGYLVAPAAIGATVLEFYFQSALCMGQLQAA